MSRLLELLQEKPLTLVVELPESTVEMAKAAEDAGAQALIIKHGFDDEKILESVSIPVGLDISKEIPEDVDRLINMNFDFINFPPESIDKYVSSPKGKIVSLDDNYNLDKLMSVNEESVEGINAAIVPIHQQVKDLLVGDLQNYIAIALSSNLPVLIPTQRSIKISEVPIIWDTGAKGLILTKTVLGDTVKSVSKAVKEYKIAVDGIDPDA